MLPSVDWLLENATELEPNIWRADSPLPAPADWPVPDHGQFETHADARGPRLVLLHDQEPEQPRLFCVYPCEIGITNLDPEAPERPLGAQVDDGQQTLVGALVGLTSESPDTDCWTVHQFDALPAVNLVLAVSYLMGSPITPEVSAVVLAISRGQDNAAPVSPTDLLVMDQMIAAEMADLELLKLIRDDQLYRFLSLLEEAKDDLERQGLADQIPQIQGIEWMREAADRAEGRRRLEGLIS